MFIEDIKVMDTVIHSFTYSIVDTSKLNSVALVI